MPSSKLFGIPVNNIIFIILNIVFICSFLYNQRIGQQCAKIITGLIALLMVIILYYFYGILCHRDMVSARSELLAILSTVAPILVLAYLINLDENYFQNICRTLLIGTSIYCVTKLLFMFIIITTNIGVVDLYNSVFGLKAIVGGDIGGGFRAPFIRIITNNDILTLFLLALLVMADREQLSINKYLKFTMAILFIVSLLIAYSRFIYFMLLYLFVIYGYIYAKRYVIVIAIILGLSIYFFAGSKLSDVVLWRFSRDYVSISDDLRHAQNFFLIKDWKEHFFFGKGVGAYSNNLIRSEDQKYLYESQMLSFGLKFGVIGIIVLLPFIIYPIRILLRYILNRQALIIISLYLLFLIGCNTNPYLLSTASGCVFVLFIIMQYRFVSLMKCRITHG